VLKRLSATAERYIIYFNFCIPVRSCENQGASNQDDNYLSSSRKDQKNWVNSKLSVDVHGTAMSLGLNILASE
jgi:flagellar motor switch protein FliM